MKLKCIPADFQVYERSSVEPGTGSFALYQLRKTGMGTPEAVTSILQRWKIPRHALHYGGLKDRHAITEQFVTIQKGPRRNLEQDNLQLTYLGQIGEPFRADKIKANRFVITMRSIAKEELQEILSRVTQIEKCGVPNYFDDQRFGSVGYSGEYIGAAWCKGEYERALWLCMADPNEHDRSDEKKQKVILRDLWGKWIECKAALDRSHRRSVVTYLCDHPTDFKRALALVRVDLRSLYLSAFQSYLWNHILSAALQQALPETQLSYIEIGKQKLAVPRATVPEDQLDFVQSLPLPSARLHFLPRDPLGHFYDDVLAKLGWDLRSIKVKYPRDSFFSRGVRVGLMSPQNFSSETGEDELYPGKKKLTLSFDLIKGSYATMVIKMLTEKDITFEALEDDEEEG
jgi:tRNA pseudouridine13 synthase